MGGVEFAACELALQDDLKRSLLIFDRDVEAADEGIASVRARFKVRLTGVRIFSFAQQPEWARDGGCDDTAVASAVAGQRGRRGVADDGARDPGLDGLPS